MVRDTALPHEAGRRLATMNLMVVLGPGAAPLIGGVLSAAFGWRSLFYANLVVPFGDTHKNVAAYFGRLMERPSFARVVEEAKPYFHMFPK